MDMTESIGPIIQKIQQSQAFLSIVSAKRHLLLDAFYLSLKSILKTPGLEPNIRAIATTQIPFFTKPHVSLSADNMVALACGRYQV
jgi:hypothetical protein